MKEISAIPYLAVVLALLAFILMLRSDFRSNQKKTEEAFAENPPQRGTPAEEIAEIIARSNNSVRSTPPQNKSRKSSSTRKTSNTQSDDSNTRSESPYAPLASIMAWATTNNHGPSSESNNRSSDSHLSYSSSGSSDSSSSSSSSD